MKRRKLTLSDKVAILLRQALCPLCELPLYHSAKVKWDHRVPLAIGGSDTNDNMQGLCEDCDEIKTYGTKATTAGSDIGNIAKARRRAKRNAEFNARMAEKKCGEKRQQRGRIKFPGFAKGHRPLRRQNDLRKGT